MLTYNLEQRNDEPKYYYIYKKKMTGEEYAYLQSGTEK